MRQCLSILLLSILLIARIIGAPDLTGDWIVEFSHDSNQSVDSEVCRFEHIANKITGHCSTDMRTNHLSGSVDGDEVTWVLKSGSAQQITVTFTGSVREDVDSMEGKWEFVDNSNGATGAGTFQARRR